MKIKQFEMVSDNIAVLATEIRHMREACFDRKRNYNNYAWALIDGEGDCDDYIALIEIDEDGCFQICDKCLTAKIELCPKCGYSMNPYYNINHKPTQYQECQKCGYILDLDNFGYEEGGESDGK
ncbi:MAG: hypothetical protein IJ435_10110 [Clostridia bacterium]|nr:hypothetical protein [Clostridia bacterium]